MTEEPIYRQGTMTTKERQNQNGGIIIETIHERDGNTIYTRRHRAKFSSVLEHYLWRNFITEIECDVGEKFGREYLRSVLKVKTADTGSHGDLQDPFISRINGNKLLKIAFDSLNSYQREIVISVCVYNQSAGTTKKILRLRKTLQILGEKWGMVGKKQ